LKTEKQSGKTITSAVTYNLLLNRVYQDLFKYHPVFERELPENAGNIKILSRPFCEDQEWLRQDIISHYFNAVDEIT
jgi:hypothetical protein